MLTGITEPRDDGSRDLVIGLCSEDWNSLLKKRILHLDDILPGYTIVLVATEEETTLFKGLKHLVSDDTEIIVD